MVTVGELLNNKGRDVWTIDPQKTVYEALEFMSEKNVGVLVVVKDQKVVGVISERDYAREIVLKGKSSSDTPVREIMTTKVCYVSESNKIDECMALMTEMSVRHLPVLENKELVGIVSIGDVVKSVISEQEFVIGQLVSYITGK
jgi:CBS domain-containing protein